MCANGLADSTKGLTVNRTNIDEVVEMLSNAETVVIVSVVRQEVRRVISLNLLLGARIWCARCHMIPLDLTADPRL